LTDTKNMRYNVFNNTTRRWRNERGENTRALSKLQNLDEERVDLIVNAINSCTIVQDLEKLKVPMNYTQRLEHVLRKENTIN
jgi:hypothetical protein